LRSAQDVLVAAWARVIAGVEEHSALPGIDPPRRKWDDQWQLTVSVPRTHLSSHR
jgi:hypothetical protein